LPVNRTVLNSTSETPLGAGAQRDRVPVIATSFSNRDHHREHQ
jgi:hypothetical protein